MQATTWNVRSSSDITFPGSQHMCFRETAFCLARPAENTTSSAARSKKLVSLLYHPWRYQHQLPLPMLDSRQQQRTTSDLASCDRIRKFHHQNPHAQCPFEVADTCGFGVLPRHFAAASASALGGILRLDFLPSCASTSDTQEAPGHGEHAP